MMRILDALLPPRCPLCQARAGHGFCADCRPLLPWILAACEVCGVALPEAAAAGSGVCGACQKRRPYYDHALIPFKYGAPVAGQIQALKYHAQLRYAAALGAMICARAWKDPRPPPQALVPVPLHRRRLRQRGFNQSLEIARRVGAELGLEVRHKLLARIRHTAPQTALSRTERRRNVRGAFRARPAAALPAHVALIDDVVTSGSTANAAARELKRAGVRTVSIWAAARAGG
ncbi:MAG: ComF family protein [Gammaproteobacteria bacterium]|nr:ComF family protein [Gammaproteobacteria bacterium]